ncbi:MAG TPA: hypothetical protein DD473_13445 [Planctomycetaceae bacterium]|nr:hypothetical protein [Planctomycetaceae bacterium]
MDKQQFWKIVAQSRPSKDAHPKDCEPRQIELLKELDGDEIVEWNHIFDQLAKDAYTCDQIAACILINGGAGDDGFYYYRCWLIGMGQEVYENALANPDSLVDVVSADDVAEAEIYAAAHRAWMVVTGNPDTAPYPSRNEQTELKGQDWNIDDEAEVTKRMPRLSKMFD